MQDKGQIHYEMTQTTDSRLKEFQSQIDESNLHLKLSNDEIVNLKQTIEDYKKVIGEQKHNLQNKNVQNSESSHKLNEYEAKIFQHQTEANESCQQIIDLQNQVKEYIYKLNKIENQVLGQMHKDTLYLANVELSQKLKKLQFHQMEMNKINPLPK